MKKRTVSSQHPSSSSHLRRSFFRSLPLLLVLLSILFCALTFFRIHFSPPSRFLFDPVAAVLRSPQDPPFSGSPKIAFLFLSRAGLPLDFLWHAFFQNAQVGNFSIYIHSQPGFAFNASTTGSSFFYGRQLRNSVKVSWGESSMIEAERLLLKEALEDPANQWFALISDSCVPLYNFSYIYNYLLSSSKSFVDSFLDIKDGRYIPMMSPTIPEHKWRKGSQWITLVRRHAKVIVADHVIFSVFKNYCKRRTLTEHGKLSNSILIFKEQEHDCVPDEHYVQTLLSMYELEEDLERRTLTFTSWNKSSQKGRQNWHPITFQYDNANTQHIREIQSIDHVNYDSEHRTEWCQVNSMYMPCFLFARKFSRSAAIRLLKDGLVGPYDVSASLSSAVWKQRT